MFLLPTAPYGVSLSLNKQKKAPQGPHLQESVRRQFSLCFTNQTALKEVQGA